MIIFFEREPSTIYAVEVSQSMPPIDIEKLSWLFGNAKYLVQESLKGSYLGPRKEMITPWSTNAVEISQNMGITGISRIEELVKYNGGDYDHMLQVKYDDIDQHIFTIVHEPDPIIEIDNIGAYNQKEGLALNEEEIEYLQGVSKEINRKLTDSEVFGFSQVNSEHCRHKIFNGQFIVDGDEKKETLFQLIKKTSKEHPGLLVSAYKDNVAFIEGPRVEQFAPKTQDKPDYFEKKDFDSVISLKAETHNFPTTVEPFNGAATGSGGEIRDRLAGGQGSFPLVGSAVYMTPYSRMDNDKTWEQKVPSRPWLYQTPLEILIKASNGASDYGNKFGQPLICGSLLTFEHSENGKTHAFDKVIMLAGGVGFGKKDQSIKKKVERGDQIVVLGGDNYRIGMGGGAVSSVATGEFANAIELNAVQRSNPEMEKRVANAVRAMTELDENPIISIHDHGAGGHLNCLSELVEESGGEIHVSKLPLGDPTLSDKELMSNESQERMGLVIKEKDLDYLKRVSDRERAPFYHVGHATGDNRLKFVGSKNGKAPFDLDLKHLFGSSPKTILEDKNVPPAFHDLSYDPAGIKEYFNQVLQLEAVACKDWLTNKVDRCVSGKVAKQQTTGEIQVPLNNVAATLLDYKSKVGVATSIGHAPIAALIDPAAGSRLAIAETLTNLIWAPLTHGLTGVSLSANWMWPAKNPGENARLYTAVKAVSDFVCELGVNIPTGKDSLSMTQKYPDGKTVYSPGTVIISSVGEISDVSSIVEPVIRNVEGTVLLYLNLSKNGYELGGSSFAQSMNTIGTKVPDVVEATYFTKAFGAVQQLINEGKILSGHDISAGGMITCLAEMTFGNVAGGLNIDLSAIAEKDLVRILFSENPGIILQVNEKDGIIDLLMKEGIDSINIGSPITERLLLIKKAAAELEFDLDEARDTWFHTSFQFDQNQRDPNHAEKRYRNYKSQPLSYQFPKNFTGKFADLGIDIERKADSGLKAAIIREKGINSDREMAYCLHLAGFDVKDVHMTDLMSGRENIEEVNVIVFTGGFSNSDVLGSAKGWAGGFKYNENARTALENFYKRTDTLSLGVCNGCQLMMELGLVYPEMGEKHPKMQFNSSGKFECAFVNVDIQENDSVMFNSLSGSRLGIWLAHGEGRFQLNKPETDWSIIAKFSFPEYPGNPNGSDYAVAALQSKDGRHVAIMPHLERSLYPWNWAHYPKDRKDEVSPWIEAFINARQWVEAN
ncbi:MAG: phosphoribosylformylglycinamidine synthase [Bacteroidetes bacterium]|nr:phosphoribosylformylglycinamidine synthase [Bacteroidota bacterium]MDA1120419.1 phosphoribosylformylglycinamidine synthase [Bacteroidota bacterium]